MIPGITSILAGLVAVSETFSVEFITSTEDENNQTTYTFTDVDFGASSPTREIFLAVNWAAGSSKRTLTAASTIGGVPVTIHAQAGVADGATNQSVSAGTISALVPSGASGDVVIVLSGGAKLCAFGAYRVIKRTNIIDTATDTYSGPNPITSVVSIDSGAVGAIIAATTISATGGSLVWNTVTQDYSGTETGSGLDEVTRYAGGSVTDLAADTGRVVSSQVTTSTSPNGSALAAVSIN